MEGGIPESTAAGTVRSPVKAFRLALPRPHHHALHEEYGNAMEIASSCNPPSRTARPASEVRQGLEQKKSPVSRSPERLRPTTGRSPCQSRLNRDPPTAPTRAGTSVQPAAPGNVHSNAVSSDGEQPGSQNRPAERRWPHQAFEWRTRRPGQYGPAPCLAFPLVCVESRRREGPRSWSQLCPAGRSMGCHGCPEPSSQEKPGPPAGGAMRRIPERCSYCRDSAFARPHARRRLRTVSEFGRGRQVA